MTKSSLWIPVIIAGAAAVLVAALGASMTEIGAWYHALKKPAWQPPDWAFGPVWTVIFALAAISGVTAWRNAPDDASRDWIIGLFAANGILNVIWSALFFKLQRPDLALIEAVFLWLSVLVPALIFWSYSRTASLMLGPYLVWVTFAMVLNFEIVKLNGYGGKWI